MSGLFVSFDGPGGVGKSTLVAAVGRRLRDLHVAVHSTREPTSSPLGQLARHGTEIYQGMTMACLIAADRHHHLETEIRPALAEGRVVLCDRYVPSSLVLQCIDGVRFDTVWNLNLLADRPDLWIIVNAAPDVIERRLHERGAHSRYERLPGSSLDEHTRYDEVARFLHEQNLSVLLVDATEAPPDQLAALVADHILTLLNRGPGS